jgi:hypothetical protein
MNTFLTILWWFMAWVFVGFLVMLLVGAVLRHRRVEIEDMDERWRERWHREHG